MRFFQWQESCARLRVWLAIKSLNKQQRNRNAALAGRLVNDLAFQDAVEKLEKKLIREMTDALELEAREKAWDRLITLRSIEDELAQTLNQGEKES